jgi:hypothetical protein
MIVYGENEYPNFRIEEFFPKRVLDRFHPTRALQFLDKRVLDIAQFYRLYWGVPIFVNTYAIASQDTNFHNRGFRFPTSTVGAEFSQHKFGRAFDSSSSRITPQRMYRDILDNPEEFLKVGLTCLEDIRDTPTWLHSDCRWTQDPNNILIVRP